MNKSTMIVAILGLAGMAGTWMTMQQQAVKIVAASSTNPKTSVKVIAAAGRVEPASEEITVGPELDGRIRQMLVEEGDDVKAGQSLAILENSDFAARVALAQALITERRAVLDRLANGSRKEERAESAAVVREARAALDLAISEHDRRRTLLDRGAISRSEFDATDREVRTLTARLDAVSERSALVVAGPRDEDKREAEAAVKSAEAGLAEAQAMLDKTVIRSPIAGRILRKHRRVGESVSANSATPIVTLGDCRVLRVRIEVDEADVAQLHLGQTAWVTAQAYGDHHFTGHVIRIGQKLGRKNVHTDDPSERVDTKVLEALMELDPGQVLPMGLRVDSFINVAGNEK